MSREFFPSQVNAISGIQKSKLDRLELEIEILRKIYQNYYNHLEPLLKSLLEQLKSDTNEPLLIFSPGCGEAHELPVIDEFFKKQGRNYQFIGVDNNYPLIEKCTERFKNFPFAHFHKADVSNLKAIDEILKSKPIDALIARHPIFGYYQRGIGWTGADPDEPSSLNEVFDFDTFFKSIIPRYLKSTSLSFISCYHPWEYNRVQNHFALYMTESKLQNSDDFKMLPQQGQNAGTLLADNSYSIHAVDLQKLTAHLKSLMDEPESSPSPSV